MKAHLSEAEAKLDASEMCRRDLEGRLSLLQKKSENALGEERLKVRVLNVYTAIAGGRLALSLVGQVRHHGREPPCLAIDACILISQEQTFESILRMRRRENSIGVYTSSEQLNGMITNQSSNRITQYITKYIWVCPDIHL